MMLRFGKWLPAMLVVAGFALLGAPRDAHALLVLEGTIQYDNSTRPTIVWATQDNSTYPGGIPTSINGGPVVQLQNTTPFSGTGSGSLTLAAIGPITLQDSAGNPITGYTVLSSTTTTSKALNGDSIFSNAAAIVNNTGATVHTNIATGDNNFVGPANQASGSASGTWTSAGGTLYNTFFYDDPSNAQPIPGPLGVNGTIPGLFGSLSLTVPSSPPTISLSGDTGTVTVSDPGPFAEILRFQFDLVTGGTFVARGQNEFKSAVVPEPVSIAMAISGLPVLGLLWSRRRRPQA